MHDGGGRLVRSLGIIDEGHFGFFDLDERAPGDGEVWLDTMYSGLSAGTELSFLKGTNPYLRARWDADLCVFRDDEPGVEFPLPSLGYMEVGRVTESRTPSIAVGEVVAMAYGHRTGHSARPAEDFLVKVPSNIDALLGIYLAQMGPICANGLLHAAADVAGSNVRDLGDGVRERF